MPIVSPESGPITIEIEHEPDPRDWLVAIIDGSDDAIISKDLNGTIRTWNAGATRVFGYSAEEVVGKPITLLIPENRLDEEPAILAEIRRGNRVDHFETVRRRKDGSLVDLSLTISPVRNARGAIVGASKIARDITERRLAQEKQRLLYGEMQHRVKNLFALTAGIVSLSARSGADVKMVAASIHERLAALSRAHELTMPDWQGDDLMGQTTTLLPLIRTILQPYVGHQEIVISGEDPQVGVRALTHVALLLHELATNAAKYGSLSEPEGRLAIEVVVENGAVERSGSNIAGKQPWLLQVMALVAALKKASRFHSAQRSGGTGVRADSSCGSNFLSTSLQTSESGSNLWKRCREKRVSPIIRPALYPPR